MFWFQTLHFVSLSGSQVNRPPRLHETIGTISPSRYVRGRWPAATFVRGLTEHSFRTCHAVLRCTTPRYDCPNNVVNVLVAPLEVFLCYSGDGGRTHHEKLKILEEKKKKMMVMVVAHAGSLIILDPPCALQRKLRYFLLSIGYLPIHVSLP